jgi:hypothetical protein
LYRFLFGNPKGRRPLERPECSREDNVKMDLKGIGLEGVDLIHLAQDRNEFQGVVNLMLNTWVP